MLPSSGCAGTAAAYGGGRAGGDPSSPQEALAGQQRVGGRRQLGGYGHLIVGTHGLSLPH